MRIKTLPSFFCCRSISPYCTTKSEVGYCWTFLLRSSFFYLIDKDVHLPCSAGSGGSLIANQISWLSTKNWFVQSVPSRWNCSSVYSTPFGIPFFPFSVSILLWYPMAASLYLCLLWHVFIISIGVSPLALFLASEDASSSPPDSDNWCFPSFLC